MTSPLEKLLADLERLEKDAPREWLQSFGNRPELRPVSEYYNLCRNNAPLLVSALRECIRALAILPELNQILENEDASIDDVRQFTNEIAYARQTLDKILKMGEK